MTPTDDHRRTALPPSSVFVNLGIPGATVATALREELPRALELAPALVTVWLNVDDLFSSVAPADFERDLGTLVRASDDGFHPSTAGHAAVAGAFAEVLARSGSVG